MTFLSRAAMALRQRSWLYQLSGYLVLGTVRPLIWHIIPLCLLVTAGTPHPFLCSLCVDLLDLSTTTKTLKLSVG